MKDFIIQLNKLELGSNFFDLKINENLFYEYENTDILRAIVNCKTEIIKKEMSITVNFLFTGTVVTECDRCLDDLELPVSSEEVLIVEFGTQISDLAEADYRITILETDTKLDLSKHLYDYIMISLPIKRVHSSDKKGKSLCNPEMIANLNKYLSNKEEEEEQDNEVPSDPRWNALKNIK